MNRSLRLPLSKRIKCNAAILGSREAIAESVHGHQPSFSKVEPKELKLQCIPYRRAIQTPGSMLSAVWIWHDSLRLNQLQTALAASRTDKQLQSQPGHSLEWGMVISSHLIDAESRQENAMEPITATVVIVALVALAC